MTAPRVATDVTCTACGCLCDDVELHFDEAGAFRAERGCQRGDWWFRYASSNPPPAPALIGDRPAQLDEAISHAASFLAASRMPLIFGLDEFDTDAIRAAVALGDVLGACIDSGLDDDPAAAVFPGFGDAGCTWGEVRDRADLIVYWRCDPDVGHWRHRELVLDPARRVGTVRVVHVNGVEPFDNDGDATIIRVGDDMSAAWALRALVMGVPVEKSDKDVIDPDGVVHLADALRSARYGVILHTSTGRTRAALGALVNHLNEQLRFRLIDLGRPFNAAGVPQTVRWQSGYGNGVSFHRGYPVSVGREFSAGSLLSRGEADAVVSAGSGATHLTDEERRHLDNIPHLVISPGVPLTPCPADVTLFTSIPGVHSGGTIFRGDGVTVPLRPAFSTSVPAPEMVIKRLTEAVRSARA
jgi:formylmethanofuran dehydrogenase subunit B